MKINSKTSIGKIINSNPAALDAILSLSPKFEKLRNPVLRKLIAGRATIEMASKIGDCTVDDFYKKLLPLGFDIEEKKMNVNESKKPVPDFVLTIAKEKIIDFDVRPILASGTDPLKQILEKIKSIKKGEVLRIINTFEPVPLIIMLGKKGYDVYSDVQNENYTETWFYKKHDVLEENPQPEISSSADWETILSIYKENLLTLDVRQMEMPMPMMTILDNLENMPQGKALYVYHKRIPVFLIPELKEKGFDFRINELSENEVHIIIFKK
ncbi:MAG: DUF2249 domain-containing protein [Bacteroidetes bacterium]|nr:DUF2249 domain-containing protein [Bacteroidota bacterium]